MSEERIRLRSSISASPEVAHIIHNLPRLTLAKSMPPRMQGLLDHLKNKMNHTLQGMEESGKQLFITGPEWARENPHEAGTAHAQVIHAAYGPTYALPNRDPANNTRAIQNGELDMFLIFDEKENRAIGTACTVLDNGRDELGRTASLGHVGNSLIQDLRIMQWLTNEETARKTHTLFATLRTAPDRDIGEKELMRGGQGVCHIWSEMPGAVIEGFGPLYKKHGKLEQFACMSLTRLEQTMPREVFVRGLKERHFVEEFALAHGMGPVKDGFIFWPHENWPPPPPQKFIAHVPPRELGIHTLVHADLELGKGNEGGTLPEILQSLTEFGSPFVQVTVPIEHDTRALQAELEAAGFHGFQIVPKTKQNEAAMVFGKILDGSEVVPTFWNARGAMNPFWGTQIPNGENIPWKSDRSDIFCI